MMHSGVNYWILLFLIFSSLIPARFEIVCQNCINSICSEDNICKYGCNVGFTGKRCSYECENNCKDSNCELNEKGVIACRGCVDGYCGTKCAYNCSEHCTTCKQKHCECTTNSHGNDSDVTECRPNCQKCKEDGTCSFCGSKRFGNECEFTCTQCVPVESLELFTPQTDCEKCSPIDVSKIMTSLHVNTAFGVIVTILIASTIICGVILYRRNKKKPSRQDRGDIENIMMGNLPVGKNNEPQAGEQAPGENNEPQSGEQAPGEQDALLEEE